MHGVDVERLFRPPAVRAAGFAGADVVDAGRDDLLEVGVGQLRQVVVGGVAVAVRLQRRRGVGVDDGDRDATSVEADIERVEAIRRLDLLRVVAAGEPREGLGIRAGLGAEGGVRIAEIGAAIRRRGVRGDRRRQHRCGCDGGRCQRGAAGQGGGPGCGGRCHLRAGGDRNVLRLLQEAGVVEPLDEHDLAGELGRNARRFLVGAQRHVAVAVHLLADGEGLAKLADGRHCRHVGAERADLDVGHAGAPEQRLHGRDIGRVGSEAGAEIGLAEIVAVLRAAGGRHGGGEGAERRHVLQRHVHDDGNLLPGGRGSQFGRGRHPVGNVAGQRRCKRSRRGSAGGQGKGGGQTGTAEASLDRSRQGRSPHVSDNDLTGHRNEMAPVLHSNRSAAGRSHPTHGEPARKWRRFKETGTFS